MSTDFDQLVQQYERFQQASAQAEDRLARYQGMGEELGQLRSSVRSPDRAVTVVAGPNGSVVDIQFAEAAAKLSPTQLSATVMATLREAVATAARQQAAVVQSYVGEDMNVLDQVLQTQAELMGTTVEELRHRDGGERPRSDDEDFGGRSVMREEGF